MKATVIHNSLWGAKQGFLTLMAAKFAEAYKAGQMCMLSVADAASSTDPLLRRPFAPYDVNPYEGTISIMYAITGRGTLLLSKQSVGTALSLSLPHGRAFTLASNSKAALVAGGVGVGPMHFLAKTLNNSGCDVTIFYGARTAMEFYTPFREKPAPYKWILCTEDGSLGYKGFVTRAFADKASLFDMCYTCGPKPMMKAVQAVCAEYNKPLELSMEETMACGIGVCSGCMVRIIEDGATTLQRCCTEGPVFDGHSIMW